MPDQPSPRRRFQFRLRTLFVIVAIVAVQCAVCLPMLREWQRLQGIEAILKTIRWSGSYRGGQVTIRWDENLDEQP